MKPPRRSKDPWDAAEAVFKPGPPALAPPPKPQPGQAGLPKPKEQVSLRIDQDILDAFQADGPGWQDRMVDALRRAAGL